MMVVRNQVFHFYFFRPLRVLPLRANHQPVSILEARLGLRRLEKVHTSSVVRRFRTPPRFPKKENSQHHYRRNHHHHPGPSSFRGWRCFSRLQISFARSRSGNKHQPNRKEHHQKSQQPAQRPIHRQRSLRKRRHRHGKLSLALTSFSRHAHLQRARFHQP